MPTKQIPAANHFGDCFRERSRYFSPAESKFEYGQFKLSININLKTTFSNNFCQCLLSIHHLLPQHLHHQLNRHLPLHNLSPTQRGLL